MTCPEIRKNGHEARIRRQRDVSLVVEHVVGIESPCPDPGSAVPIETADSDITGEVLPDLGDLDVELVGVEPQALQVGPDLRLADGDPRAVAQPALAVAALELPLLS